MNRNKQRNTQEHYFDPHVLENYLRLNLQFELAGRQEGRRIAKGETRMKRKGELKDDNN